MKGKGRINSDGDSEDGNEGCSVSYDSDVSESKESIASDKDIDDVTGSDAPSDENEVDGEDRGDKTNGSKSKRRRKGSPIILRRSKSHSSHVIPFHVYHIKYYREGQSIRYVQF